MLPDEVTNKILRENAELRLEVARLQQENERLYKKAYSFIPVPKWMQRRTA